MSTRCVKELGQRNLTIFKTLPVGTTTVVIVCKDTDGVTKGTVTLTSPQVSSFISLGQYTVAISDLITDDIVSDGFYNLTITVDDVDDIDGGFGYTANATGKYYAATMNIVPSNPDFHLAQIYHTAKMLLDEMNSLEDFNVPQRSYQFDKRLAIFKDILNYA